MNTMSGGRNMGFSGALRENLGKSMDSVGCRPLAGAYIIG
jgi:hypothetical protein